MLSETVFNKGMAILGAAYPDYECTAETVDVYRERLRRLSDLDFERAVNRHIDTCKWFPKVSEILDAAQSLLPTPIDAWNRLIAAAESGEKPELDAATERALNAIGGWQQFQFTSYADLQFRFKEFKTAYLEARARNTLAIADGGAQKALPGSE